MYERETIFPSGSALTLEGHRYCRVHLAAVREDAKNQEYQSRIEFKTFIVAVASLASRIRCEVDISFRIVVLDLCVQIYARQSCVSTFKLRSQKRDLFISGGHRHNEN